MLRTNHRINRVELRGEARDLLLVLVGWSPGECHDRRMNTVGQRLDQGGCRDRGVVDGELGGSHHAAMLLASPSGTALIEQYSHDNEARDIHPHREVANPSQALERSNTSADNTDNHDNDHADDKAESRSSKLRHDSSTSQNQDHDRAELLDGLRDVNSLACLFTEDSEVKVAETEHRETCRIQLDEDFPEHETADTGEDTEDDIEGDTGPVADTGEDEAAECRQSQRAPRR